MAGNIKVTESWITKAIVYRLKEITMAYKPTGDERKLSLRTLHSCIDPSWMGSYESRSGPGIEWIAFPIITEFFRDLKTDDDRIIILRITFSYSKAVSEDIFFRANNEILPIQFIEQGIIIMQNLESVIQDVHREIVQERLKVQKVKSMVEGSAEAAIIDALRDTGLSYHMLFLEDKLELRVLFPYSREALFSIPYKHFGDYISCLSAQINHINQAIVGFPFTLKKAECKIKWTTSK